MPEMTFWDHIEELRKRTLYALVAILILACAAFFYYDQIFMFLENTMLPPDVSLIVITPFEALFARIKISLALAVILSLPVLLFEMYRFLSPSFSSRQKKRVYLLLMFFLVLFFMGLAFSLFILTPLTFKFLLAFAYPFAQPLLSLDAVVDVVVILSLGSALCFQIPLAMIISSVLGIGSSELFAEKKAFFILGITVLAAVITPDPTGITMVLLMLPLIVLYEIGIVLTKKF
jgi:sec-independent protein translocase protein TatC